MANEGNEWPQRTPSQISRETRKPRMLAGPKDNIVCCNRLWLRAECLEPPTLDIIKFVIANGVTHDALH